MSDDIREFREPAPLDAGDEALLERVAGPLRAPERVSEGFRERVMDAVHAEARRGGHPTPRVAGRRARERGWWLRPRVVRVTPAAIGALAAGIAAVVIGGAALRHAPRAPRADAPLAVAATHDTVFVVRFVFVDSAAHSVALVGDFNNWDRAATRLTPSGHRGAWTASVALPPGRHEYAFVIDGTRWSADPRAALSMDDDFGAPSSIVIVGPRSL